MTANYQNYLDRHPDNPANFKEPVARYGSICPNQFSDERFEGLGLTGRAETSLDADEALVVAQQLANETGITVRVEFTDENGWEAGEKDVSPEAELAQRAADHGVEIDF